MAGFKSCLLQLEAMKAEKHITVGSEAKNVADI
jgi:hypothetical protein